MLTGDKGATAREIAQSCGLVALREHDPNSPNPVVVTQGIEEFNKPCDCLNSLNLIKEADTAYPTLQAQKKATNYQIPDTSDVGLL